MSPLKRCEIDGCTELAERWPDNKPRRFCPVHRREHGQALRSQLEAINRGPKGGAA